MTFTRILRFPATWLAIGIVTVGAASTLVTAGPVLALVGAALALGAYVLVMRFVAGRRLPELSLRHALRDSLIGVGLGVGFLVVSVGTITLLGGYRFSTEGAVGLSALPALIAVTVAVAVTEELLFRGLLQQALERFCGAPIALVLTAIAFGLTHAANPGATVWSTIAIAVQAGGVLGAAFLWRRSLWLVFSLHIVWNGLQQLIGIPVSGHVAPGLFVATTQGPALLTGGEFGLEGSLVTVILGLVLAVALVRAARSRRVSGTDSGTGTGTAAFSGADPAALSTRG